jgi:hypothetical protein
MQPSTANDRLSYAVDFTHAHPRWQFDLILLVPSERIEKNIFGAGTAV